MHLITGKPSSLVRLLRFQVQGIYDYATEHAHINLLYCHKHKLTACKLRIEPKVLQV